MAHISYSKKNWTDTSSSGNTLNAASLNNIENGIVNSVDKINSIDDKISTVDKIYCGSVVRTMQTNGEVILFSDEQFKRHFGKSFNGAYDAISVQNGDWNACPHYLSGAVHVDTTKKLWAYVVDGYDGVERKVRINFIIAIGNVDYNGIENGTA